MKRLAGLTGLALVAVAASVWPLVGRGLPVGHDTYWELIRVAEFTAQIEAGTQWPRWAPSFSAGYGSPIFHFFPPVFLQVAARLQQLGLGLEPALKLALVSLAAACWLGWYRLGRRLTRAPWPAAAIASVVLLDPYRFFDLCGRAAWAELTSLTGLPFLLYATDRVLRAPPGDRSSGPGWVAITTLGLVSGSRAASHNLSVLLFCPIVVTFVVLRLPAERRHVAVARLVAGFALGALLSGSFWIPALFDLHAVKMGWDVLWPAKVTAALLSPRDFGSPPWLGIGLWMGPLLLLGARGPSSARALAAIALVTAAATTTLLRPLWELSAVVAPIAFPWRLFGPAAALASLSALTSLRDPGGAGPPSRQRSSTLGALLALAAMGSSVSWLAVGTRRVVPAELGLGPARFRSEWVTTTMIDEFRPVEVTGRPPRDPPALLLPADATLITPIAEPGRRGARVRLARRAAVGIPVLRFPAWSTEMDGVSVANRRLEPGLYVVEVPAGEHEVYVRWLGTEAQRIGELSSLLALISIPLLLGLHWLRSAHSSAPPGAVPAAAPRSPAPHDGAD